MPLRKDPTLYLWLYPLMKLWFSAAMRKRVVPLILLAASGLMRMVSGSFVF